jgi:hypothetical protein
LPILFDGDLEHNGDQGGFNRLVDEGAVQ